MSMKKIALVAPLVFVACLGVARRAAADTSVIRRPGLHTRYSFEAEPHLLLGFYDPAFDNAGLGVGFRGTIPIVDRGFVTSINDSVGIGFGFDWLRHGHAKGDCIAFDPQRNDHCIDYETSNVNDFVLPVVMQWNFFLSRNWSVFGEPGVAFDVRNPGNDRFRPVAYVGGRWHFAESATLTMRIGWPTASVGVSFLI